MAEPLPIATIVHAMPGRTRLRMPERRGDMALFASIAAGLSAVAGVHKVEVLPLTGSILLHHDTSLAQIGEVAHAAHLFALEGSGPALALFPEPEKLVRPFDPRQAAVLGLAVVAFWQILKGHVLPPALTVAWYALHLSGMNAGPDDAD